MSTPEEENPAEQVEETKEEESKKEKKVEEKEEEEEEKKTEEEDEEDEEEEEEKEKTNGEEKTAEEVPEKEKLGDPIPDKAETEEEDDEELTAEQKIQLEDAVMADQYDLLLDLTHSYEDISIPIEFLSASHAHLGDKTFLHVAASRDMVNTVECLLALGCDPGIVDNEGKTPYEKCKTVDTKEVFVSFRKDNARKFDWNRAKIPASVAVAKKGRGARGKRVAKKKKGSSSEDDDDDEEYRPTKNKRGRAAAGGGGRKKRGQQDSDSDY